MDNKPDALIIHVGISDILTNANHEEIAPNIIKIGWNCKNYCVNLFYFSQKNPYLNVFI